MECFIEFSEVLCGRKEAGKRCRKCSSSFFLIFWGGVWGCLRKKLSGIRVLT